VGEKKESGEGEMGDLQQAWALLSEEERDVFGRAIDALVWVTRPRLRNLIFRRRYAQEVLDLAAKAMSGALGVGYSTGFRAVEQFAKLSGSMAGGTDEEKRQLLVDFVERSKVRE
jgi:hypothetical protein